MTNVLTDTPTVSNVRRHNGIAGQFAMTATVAYPYETPQVVEFVGSVYGESVVMITEKFGQVMVSDPSRFGSFAIDPARWVRRFFGGEK